MALAALAIKIGPEIIPWATAALHDLAYMMVSHPVAGMSMSAAGRELLIWRESEAGVSNQLYWPKGDSGVTLGAGYDMKARSAVTIKTDLIAIGVAPASAEAASKGAGKVKSDASDFIVKNSSAVSLTMDQETALLKLVLLSTRKSSATTSRSTSCSTSSTPL